MINAVYRLFSVSISLVILVGISTSAFATGPLGIPPVPSFVTVPATTANGKYEVTWGSSSGADYYVLQERKNNGNWASIYNGAMPSQPLNFAKTEVADYGYRAQACSDEAVCSAFTSPASVSVTGGFTIQAAIPPGKLVGSLPYGMDVASDGDLRVSVPIQMVPGLAGFQPDLSFEYDGGRGINRLERSLPEDTIGYGWRLAGVSQIRRCVTSKSASASIKLTSVDRLCLDGMPLLLVSGTDFSAGAEYRTRIESFIKIEAKELNGSLWFEVTLPDGTVQQYGSTANSRVNKSGGVDYQWSINSATSTDGNTINFEYWFDSSSGTNRILEISYPSAAVDFEYLTRSDADPVNIHSTPQTQDAFLHTVRVSHFNGSSKNATSEYFLKSELVDGRRRLNELYFCGYDINGSNPQCFEPLDFDWWTAPSAQAIDGAEILIDGVFDSLGAVHQVEYGTITGSTEPGPPESLLFAERPFGDGSAPANSQELSGPDPIRNVVVKLSRDNGVGTFHDTSYSYQGTGLESTKHWGFLGFYAQRITVTGRNADNSDQDLVTYVQYRMDYPYHGQVAKVLQTKGNYAGSSNSIAYVETDYAKRAIKYSTGDTHLPYASAVTSFIFENTSLLGASRTTNTLSYDTSTGIPVDQFIGRVFSNTEIGTGISSNAFPHTGASTWGDAPSRSITNLEHTSHNTVNLLNRQSGSDWLIGFADDAQTENWAGGTGGSSLMQKTDMTPIPGSMLVSTATQFPDDPGRTDDDDLELTRTFTYFQTGRISKVTLAGDHVGSRTTEFFGPSFTNSIKNAKGHITPSITIDKRFRTMSSRGDLNQRMLYWSRDPVGRIKHRVSTDGVNTSTEYTDCSSGAVCPMSIYGVAPVYKLETTSAEGSTQVAPKRATYVDNLGRVLRTERESFSGTFIKTDTKYDDLGRLEKSTLPYISGTPAEVTYKYDLYDRIHEINRPDGSRTTTNYSVLSDRVIETITERVNYSAGFEDQVKVNEYNILGQLTKTTDGFGSSKSPVTTFDYDGNGNVKTVVVDAGTTAEQTTTYEYDAAGNQKTMISPDIGTVTSKYTALNQLRERTDNMNQVATYTYDSLNRIKTMNNIDGLSQWYWDTALNGKGQLDYVTGPGYTETRYYNQIGQLDAVRKGIAPIGSSTLQNYTTDFYYYGQGRTERITYASGVEILRNFNARGFLEELKDGSNSILTIDRHNDFGQIDKETYGNGVISERVFDPLTGRLTNISSKKNSTFLQNESFDWRSNGTLDKRTALVVSGVAHKREERYEYDILNRVEKAKTVLDDTWNRNLVYGFDNMGNLTKKTSTNTDDLDVTNYIYGDLNAGPNAATKATVGNPTVGHMNYTLTYNANGAVEKYKIGNSGQFDKHIRYNAFNQPIKVVVGDGGINDATPDARDEFSYDPMGRRIARRTTWKDGTDTVEEKAFYVGSVEVVERSVPGASSETITKTQVSPSIMHVKHDDGISTESYEYAHRDHLGSIVAVSDEDGNVLDHMAYEVYGSRRAKDWSSNIPTLELNALLDMTDDHAQKTRGFTGHEHMDRTGLVHMNGRVYDPTLGRFLSPDPIVQLPSYSQSWNRYSYVMNSPASLIDPSGFMSDDVPIDIQDIDDPDDDNSEIDNWRDHKAYSESVFDYLINGGGLGDAYTRERIMDAYSDMDNQLANYLATRGSNEVSQTSRYCGEASNCSSVRFDLFSIIGNSTTATGLAIDGYASANVARTTRDGSMLLRYTTLSSVTRESVIWLRVQPGMLELSSTGTSIQATKLARASFALGGVSTTVSFAQTIKYLERRQHADAALSGLDTTVGGIMFTGPQGAAFGLGYFGSRLTIDAAEAIAENFWPEPLISGNP